MPHIIVKLYTGRSEEQKTELTEKIVKSVVETTHCKDTSVSVAIEEFEENQWARVYQNDILDGPGKLYKKPGYDPFDAHQKKKNQDHADLMTYVRGAADRAAAQDTDGRFNPMSWLDLELEDNPQSFDPFFDTPWEELSDPEKAERMTAVRRVL